MDARRAAAAAGKACMTLPIVLDIRVDPICARLDCSSSRARFTPISSKSFWTRHSLNSFLYIYIEREIEIFHFINFVVVVSVIESLNKKRGNAQAITQRSKCIRHTHTDTHR